MIRTAKNCWRPIQMSRYFLVALLQQKSTPLMKEKERGKRKPRYPSSPPFPPPLFSSPHTTNLLNWLITGIEFGGIYSAEP